MIQNYSNYSCGVEAANQEQVQQTQTDKFKFFKKWFWAGIVVGFLYVLAGLVYGILLIFEKGHRREGAVIVAFAIAWGAFSYFIVGPWLADYLVEKGLLVRQQAVQQNISVPPQNNISGPNISDILKSSGQ